MLSRVKRVYELCFKQRMLLAFHIRLYHAVDRSLCGWWCDFKQVVSQGGLTCLKIMLDGFQSI
jgi:hypothetical protein